MVSTNHNRCFFFCTLKVHCVNGSMNAGTGSKSVPATDGSTSDGTIMELPLTLTILALFIASHASTCTGF